MEGVVLCRSIKEKNHINNINPYWSYSYINFSIKHFISVSCHTGVVDREITEQRNCFFFNVI